MKKVKVRGIVGIPIYLLMVSTFIIILLFSLTICYVVTKPRIGYIELYLNGSRITQIPITNITKDGYAYYDAKKFGQFLVVRVLTPYTRPIQNAYVHVKGCGLDNHGWTNTSGYAKVNITFLRLTPEQMEAYITITVHAFGFLSETYWVGDVKVFRKAQF